MDEIEQQDSPEGYGSSPRAIASRWIDAIRLAEKQHKKWWKDAEKVLDRYKDERNEFTEDVAKFNVLWSNVETTKPAIYARPPKPVAKRRYKDKDQVGRHAAEIMERALDYCVDAYDFHGACQAGVEDYLLPGRWADRVMYKPVFGAERRDPERLLLVEGVAVSFEDGSEAKPEDVQMDEQGMPYRLGKPYRPVIDEYVLSSHVHYRDFIHSPGRKWEDVSWVAFKTYLRRDELKERFGKIGEDIPLDYKPEGMSDDDEKTEQFKKAVIYEIWDKAGNQVVWISAAYPSAPLDIGAPHLDLEGFFPCAPPLLAVSTNDSLMPMPEFLMYADQARELDRITARIAAIVESVKVVGVYAGENNGIERMMNEGVENTLIAVPDFAMTGRVEDAIGWYPVKQAVDVLITLYDARDQVKHVLYEVTGMSDLFRGDTRASETATAQRIKSQFGSMRLQQKQRAVQRKIRDILRVKAEIIAEKFSQDTLQRMTGIEVTPEVMQLLRDDKMRSFRIDVETDSTIQADEAEEKAARIEFIQAASQYLGQAIQVTRENPELGRLTSEMLMWGVRGFQQGRELEGVIEETMDALQNQQPQQQPNPELIKAQQDAQKMQADAQESAARLQMDKVARAMDMQNAQADRQLKLRELALKEREQALSEWEAQQKYGGEERKLSLDEFQVQQTVQREEAQAMADYDVLNKVMESMADALERMDQSSQQLLEAATKVAEPNAPQLEAQTQAINDLASGMEDVLRQMTAPKKLIRDEKGRAVGVETVQSL